MTIRFDAGSTANMEPVPDLSTTPLASLSPGTWHVSAVLDELPVRSCRVTSYET
jgi:hypothetical protein